MNSIESERVQLINCSRPLIEIILKGDRHIAKEFNIRVPEQWSEFGGEIFEYALKMIDNGVSEKWGAYIPIEKKGKVLIGSCGFKGEPSKEGIVEIGYEIAKDYRNKGYATEITNLLVSNAFTDNAVKQVQAHTLAEENASVKVLKKNGFKFVEAFEDDEDGLIWKWALDKESF